MIVDDMEIMRVELKRLKIWGEELGFIIVDEAKDGREAFEKLKRRKVDLLITDIRMQVMDGIELLKEVIKSDLSSCVVFMSEYSEFEYARQALVYGAFDYIVKPIEAAKMEEMLLKVSEYLTEKRIEKEKIEKLEEQFEEKIESFYTNEETELIIKLFKNVDLTVDEKASNLIETMAAAFNYDFVKMVYILNRMLERLLEALEEIYPWLYKLIDISRYKNVDFIKYGEFYKSKERFLEIIKELIMIISRFEFGNQVNSMVRQVCKIVLEHVDGEISIKGISDELFLSTSYLSTLYKEKTGKSLIEYITMVKMERAKRLLNDLSMKNYEISEKLGYKDAEYFSKLFKKYTGTTPSDFRNNLI